MPTAPPRPAATVVLLRDQPAGSGFEVFLVRRHDNMAFMGGAYAFPGGRVDSADAVPLDAPWCSGAAAAAARLADLSPQEALGYHIAALRELFEESGVLLARTADDGPLHAFPPDLDARLADARRALAGRTATFGSIVQDAGLRLAPDLLAPLSHWVTPDIESRRFDTRFFLARVPPGQVPVHDSTETTDSEWMTPAHAVERHQRNDIWLPPPTWTTIRELARSETVEAVLAWAVSRPIVRIQPAYVQRPDLTMLTLPGDPLQPAIPGFEVPEETRFVLRNGRFYPVKVGDPAVPI